ncbi:C-C motif chemokine 19-like [Eucyclogobius newberryi]|uniref:C-C motif chemokine 19-like n=1 Tax=Eucyclogobius newberryi TaxID=166745 RepID=UPI003B5B60FC
MSPPVLHVPRVLCAVLCCILLSRSVVVGQIPLDCCLQVTNRPVPKGLLVDYSVQVAGQGCDIDAVVLVTRQQRTVCIPPSYSKLHQILEHVDKLKLHCQKKNYKGRRCVGVKPQ